METISIVYITVPDLETAQNMAHTLVEERYAACVNLVPHITSIYRWDGVVQEDSEVLLIVKTVSAKLEYLHKKVHELHPYEIPEFLAVPVTDASQDYLAWVHAGVGGS